MVRYYSTNLTVRIKTAITKVTGCQWLEVSVVFRCCRLRRSLNALVFKCHGEANPAELARSIRFNWFLGQMGDIRLRQRNLREKAGYSAHRPVDVPRQIDAISRIWKCCMPPGVAALSYNWATSQPKTQSQNPDVPSAIDANLSRLNCLPASLRRYL